MVVCDEQRIMQVLLNLQSNALKFTRKGFVKINVEVARDEAMHKRILRVMVTDTGVGISKED